MTFDEQLDSLTAPGAQQKIPGAVLLAADATGQTTHSYTKGVTSPDPDAAKPMTAETTFHTASCTKLLTTISILQCVERGQLTLDDDISKYLDEWKEPDLLVGFDEQSGEPILHKAQKKITIHHLLTHSWGNANDLASPTIQKWKKWNNKTLGAADGSVFTRFLSPLLFEAGDGWVYGGGLDWSGQIIERIHGGIRLGDYMKKHIFEPLKMESSGFRPSENARIREHLCATTIRTSTGALENGKPFAPENPVHDQGGGGLYSSATDYLKVLVSLLMNDGTLLKPDTVEMMFTPQLSDPKHLLAVVNPRRAIAFRGGVESEAWNWGYGGMLNGEDVEGLCKKGTMTWGGLPNLFWWIDRKAGTCGLYASQLLPPGDEISMKIFDSFRRTVARGES